MGLGFRVVGGQMFQIWFTVVLSSWCLFKLVVVAVVYWLL